MQEVSIWAFLSTPHGRGVTTQVGGSSCLSLDVLPQPHRIHEVETRSPNLVIYIIIVTKYEQSLLCSVLIESLAGRVDKHIGVSGRRF